MTALPDRPLAALPVIGGQNGVMTATPRRAPGRTAATVATDEVAFPGAQATGVTGAAPASS